MSGRGGLSPERSLGWRGGTAAGDGWGMGVHVPVATDARLEPPEGRIFDRKIL